MIRRALALLITLALALLVVPLTAEAPLPGKIPRIGWLAFGPPPSAVAQPQSAFWQRFRELGWVEGQNFTMEPRYAQEQYERLHALAAELVQLGVDVIVAGDAVAIPAAKVATRTIPIVMTVSIDPVGDGLVASLARPGGNLTGLTTMDPELAEKRLMLLKETLPGLARVAVLGPSLHGDWDELIRVAHPLGVQLRVFTVHHPDTFTQVFTAAKNEHADALIVLASLLTNRYRTRLVSLAAMHQLPAMYARKEYVEDGGLMAYGPSIPDLYRRAATYVDKILKGTKPGDLPVERPMKFDLVINLKTAQALGLSLPPTLLFQADEVIR